MLKTNTGLSYFDAYSSVRNKTPKQDYYDDFLAMSQQAFDNAPNVFIDEIEVEKEYGSNEFVKVPMVRVDSIINFNTGVALGDDFKRFLFMPDYPAPFYGQKYRWKDNYWLVINTDNDGSLNVSAELRRCNNVLRFFDKNGNKIQEPCIMDYVLRFTNNNETPPITIGNKEQKIWAQRNDRTQLIEPNDKFLFGTPKQRVALRIYAGGTKNFLNNVTMDDNSPSLTEFYLEDYQISEILDDLEGGYANAYVNNFSIKINSQEEKYKPSISSQLEAVVYKNNKVFDAPIIWETSDPNIATVDDEGLITTLAEGQVIISACMKDNDSIRDSIEITVSNDATVDFEIRLSPDIDYVLQDTTTEFSCYLYENGNQLTNTFNIVDVSVVVPRENYDINIIDGNHFSITNTKKYLKAPVKIEVTSGNQSKIYEIKLRGLY